MTDLLNDREPGERAILLTADLVAAYLTKNPLPAGELPGLIRAVHDGLVRLEAGPAATAAEEAVDRPSPTAIAKSIRPDGIVSFLNGQRYQSLKRHLGAHGLSPSAYRERFGLPIDYPMVAPNYSAQRAAIAREKMFGGPRSAAA